MPVRACFQEDCVHTSKYINQVLVEYIGDSSVAPSLPHGNATSHKSVARPFVSPAKSLIVKNVEHERISEHRKERAGLVRPSRDVETPRNRKQVENHQLIETNRKRLTRDEYWNVVELGYDCDFVQSFRIHACSCLHEDIRIFGFHNELLKMLSNLLSRDDLPVQCLSVNTY